jgi:division protein CdvB (Snf7/Vps24/ESCRT-III family)
MVERHHLVSQINNATSIVYNQLSRLKALDSRFASMEAYYLDQVAVSIKTGNNGRAKILAIELANLKKVRRTTQHTGMALEALVIRFSTLNEFAIILDTIDPTVNMIKGIQDDLRRAVPQASQALSEVSSVTADVLTSANVRAELGKISMPMDEAAYEILGDIENALETQAKIKLPEVPVDMPVRQQQEQAVMVEG